MTPSPTLLATAPCAPQSPRNCAPLASVAKKEEIVYVYGQEDDPVILDRYSPVLHLIQTARDEAHRFAITFHKKRRAASRLNSELEQIPGVGPETVQKLLRGIGSAKRVREASEEQLAEVVGPAAARRVREHFVKS